MEDYGILDDEDCEMVEVEDLATIGNEMHYSQVIDQFTAMRCDLAHDLSSYDLAAMDDSYNADVVQMVEYAVDIYDTV